MKLSEKLKKLREEKSLTLVQVAIGSGVKDTTLSEIEIGKIHSPRIDTVTKLAEFYGVSIDWLVGRINLKYLEHRWIKLDDFKQ